MASHRTENRRHHQIPADKREGGGVANVHFENDLADRHATDDNFAARNEGPSRISPCIFKSSGLSASVIAASATNLRRIRHHSNIATSASIPKLTAVARHHGSNLTPRCKSWVSPVSSCTCVWSDLTCSSAASAFCSAACSWVLSVSIRDLSVLTSVSSSVSVLGVRTSVSGIQETSVLSSYSGVPSGEKPTKIS